MVESFSYVYSAKRLFVRCLGLLVQEGDRPAALIHCMCHAPSVLFHIACVSEVNDHVEIQCTAEGIRLQKNKLGSTFHNYSRNNSPSPCVYSGANA